LDNKKTKHSNTFKTFSTITTIYNIKIIHIDSKKVALNRKIYSSEMHIHSCIKHVFYKYYLIRLQQITSIFFEEGL